MPSSVSVSFPRAVCNAAKLHVMKCGCCGLYCRWLPYVFKGRATVIVVPSSQHNKVGMSKMVRVWPKIVQDDYFTGWQRQQWAGAFHRSIEYLQSAGGGTGQSWIHKLQCKCSSQNNNMSFNIHPLPKCSPQLRLETHSLNSC